MGRIAETARQTRRSIKKGGVEKKEMSDRHKRIIESRQRYTELSLKSVKRRTPSPTVRPAEVQQPVENIPTRQAQERKPAASSSTAAVLSRYNTPQKMASSIHRENFVPATTAGVFSCKTPRRGRVSRMTFGINLQDSGRPSMATPLHSLILKSAQKPTLHKPTAVRTINFSETEMGRISEEGKKSDVNMPSTSAMDTAHQSAASIPTSGRLSIQALATTLNNLNSNELSALCAFLEPSVKTKWGLLLSNCVNKENVG
jgi:hypothetical protein